MTLIASARAGTPGRRRDWLLVWLPVCACLAAEALALRLGVDDLDEGYFVQQGLRVLHGQIAYRDFETLYTPGLAYVHAALFAVLGGAYLLGPRALALVARAGLAVLMVVLARRVVHRPLLAAAPAVYLLVGLDDAPVRWEPHPGWLSTLFALGATWCLTHRPARMWLLAGGAAAAGAYAFKQNTGAFILAAILMRGLCATHHRRTQVALPLAAFAGLTALWLVPLLIALQGQVLLLGSLVGAVNQAGLVSPPELPLLVPLAALAYGAWLARQANTTPLRWYVLAGASLFLTEYPRMDALHLAWSAPLLLVVGAACLDRLRPVAAGAFTLAALVLVAPTVSSRLAAVTVPSAPIAEVALAAGLLVPEGTATDLRDLVRDIQQRTPPGQPIFVYPTSPLLYALAERPNPTRFDHLNPGAADSRQIQEVIADLTTAHVQLVVVSDFWVTAWGPPGPNAALVDWIDTHFTQVARFRAYRVLLASL